MYTVWGLRRFKSQIGTDWALKVSKHILVSYKRKVYPTLSSAFITTHVCVTFDAHISVGGNLITAIIDCENS